MNTFLQTVMIIVVILGIAAFFALRFFKARVAKLKKDVIEMIKNPGKMLKAGVGKITSSVKKIPSSVKKF